MKNSGTIGGTLVITGLYIAAMAGTAAAQPAYTTIGSVWNRYYEALALRGDIERPYMTIRQLSRNAWEVPEELEHPWREHRGPHRASARSGGLSVHSLGVESYSSYNSRYAAGGNDGAMWQGRGFNTRLQGGLLGSYERDRHRLGATLYPLFWAAENREFELVDPADITGTSALFGDPVYGYYTAHMDLPQRHGPDPIYEVGWGESEVRYDYWNLSAGFGNQALWLGPGRQNAHILSDNAGGFPKVDVGLRKTDIHVRGYDLGTVEAISWWGRLTPSDYFDTTNYDEHNLYTGMGLAYSLPFWREFTLGFNKVAITQWRNIDSRTLTQQLSLNFSGYPDDLGGQQASLTGDWFSSRTGTNIYMEWGRWDYSSSRNPINVPGHASAFTLGARQIFDLDRHRFFLLSAEHTNLGKSREQLIRRAGLGNAGFYRQHNVGTGFTHRGQVLGGAVGPGGDSQYVSLAYYGRLGYVDLFVQRFSRNKDVLYFMGQTVPFGDKLHSLGPEFEARHRMFVEMRYGAGGYAFFGPTALGLQFTLHETRNFNYEAYRDVWNTRVELTLNWAL